jgi:hypothetical protein
MMNAIEMNVPPVLLINMRRFKVQGSGFRVQGSGFRVQDSGFRIQS